MCRTLPPDSAAEENPEPSGFPPKTARRPRLRATLAVVVVSRCGTFTRAKDDGVDISPVQIALAQRQVPGGRFRCGDIMAMSFPRGISMLWYRSMPSSTSPKEEYRELFTRIHHWLKPKGVSWNGGDGEEPHTPRMTFSA